MRKEYRLPNDLREGELEGFKEMLREIFGRVGDWKVRKRYGYDVLVFEIKEKNGNRR